MYYSNEAKKKARAERTLLALIFTALGLSIGAAIALIFAPMDGEETRHELSHQAEKARDRIENYSEHAKNSILS